ncbi:hypothetical protein MLD52_12730 [Puniceicoccaceae bacterium K14]|nr:hypothetical protein [Puniceicoccaceae bacterium K14]
MQIPRYLLEGHKAYLKETQPKVQQRQEELLKKGQSPEVLWIGCSDSRVMPETIVNSKPGDLFVVRNVGNMVHSYESGTNSVGAAIEFAVGSLGISHIIVCGHEDCGAMKAIQAGGVDANKTPSLANWIRTTIKDLGPTFTVASDLTELTKRNILLQIERLKHYPLISEALAENKISLHGWYINIKNGYLEGYDPKKQSWGRLVDC